MTRGKRSFHQTAWSRECNSDLDVAQLKALCLNQMASHCNIVNALPVGRGQCFRLPFCHCDLPHNKFPNFPLFGIDRATNIGIGSPFRRLLVNDKKIYPTPSNMLDVRMFWHCQFCVLSLWQSKPLITTLLYHVIGYGESILSLTHEEVEIVLRTKQVNWLQ